MKKVLKLILILLAGTAAVLFLYLHITVISPNSLNVRHESISSEEIPSSLDEIKLIFFSDLHYGTFVDEERLSKIVDTINSQGADLVLFGGDLFDTVGISSSEKHSAVKEALFSIQAPLGKFAVLGEKDQLNEETENIVRSVLYEGNFEVINNQSLRIRNQSAGSIVLSGLNSKYPDYDSSFSNVQNTDYVLAFSHYPDTALAIPSLKPDLFLAGHTHGGQVYLPFFGSLIHVEPASELVRGKHQIDTMMVDITNGTGTTEFDYRFLAPAEIVVYTLHSLK